MDKILNITPVDFDAFIPWMCGRWGVGAPVTVVRVAQEPYVPVQRDSDLSSKKAKKITILSEEDKENTKEINLDSDIGDSSVSLTTKTFRDTYNASSGIVTIYAYYDTNNKLVEISIDCTAEIPRKIIRVISMCLPFHTELTRLTIQKDGLTADVIKEVKTLLPESSITELCLDSTNIPQGNYFMLLQETSALNYLSLRKCDIDDTTCTNIALNLVFGKPAAETLRVVELAYNNITDIGAKALAQMLRSNRCLLHLNLSWNKITDSGAKEILSSLMEFPMTEHEVLETRRRSYKYLEKKQALKKAYLENIRDAGNMTSFLSNAYTARASVSRKLFNSRQSKAGVMTSVANIQVSPEELAENLAKAKLGEKVNLHNHQVKDGHYYSRGNLILCSLNLSCNDLQFPSVKKIAEVLQYQHLKLFNAPSATGLMRIVIEGNYLPIRCNELDEIEMYLNFSITRSFKGRRDTLKPSRRSRSISATYSSRKRSLLTKSIRDF